MALDDLDAGLARLHFHLAQLGREVQQARADYQQVRELNRSQLAIDSLSTDVLERLSPQERRVAILVANGLSNSEVAAQLHVTVHTVKSQVCSILRKLNLRSRWQLEHVLPAEPSEIRG